MDILIQSATIQDSRSPHHGKKRNVLIKSGRIANITTRNISANKVIAAEDMMLSIGWFDMGTFIGDPGLEYREDLTSAARAAAAGGFTEIAMWPNTKPSLQSKNEIHYVTRGNKSRLVQIHPMASVTLGNRGEELTEMMDLNQAGAVAFTDGLNSIWNADILLKSLQYVQPFNGLIVNRPEEIGLNKFGHMNEGINNVRLGLKGMPKIAEEIAAGRDIELLNYTGGRLHLSRISCAGTVDLIRLAKKRKLRISCDTTSYQALLSDDVLQTFDTNYKVNPPLREKSDLKALIKGLKDGTIDVLTSGHLPQNAENKITEFDRAKFGMINLQTFASQLTSLSRSVDMSDLLHKVTLTPRMLLNIQIPVIEVGAEANLTLFHPTEKWLFNAHTNYSASSNSPWLGHEIEGRAKAVFNNEKYWLNA